MALTIGAAGLERVPRIGMADAKANLSAVVAEVEQTGVPYVIMRYGKPAAVIQPMPERRESSRTARGMLRHLAHKADSSKEEGVMARMLVENYERENR